MDQIHGVAEFIVSTWLWHFTWGWTQVACNLIITIVLLRACAGIHWLQSVLLALMAHISTSLVFSACVALFVHSCELDLIDTDKYMLVYTNVYGITFPFGLLYGCLLSIFFTLFNYAYPLPLVRVYCAVMASSLLSALITPCIIHF
jgi:hypothetical protein